MLIDLHLLGFLRLAEFLALTLKLVAKLGSFGGGHALSNILAATFLKSLLPCRYV